MTVVFLLIFLFLTLLIGRDRTAKSLITLGFNAVILGFTITAINFGANPLVVTAIACTVIATVTLFYQNEINIKTTTAFGCVFAIVLLSGFGIYAITVLGNLQGFPTGQYSISANNGYLAEIGVNMAFLQISVILLMVVGAIIDTSLAVSSALYEVKRNNPDLGSLGLFKSGINIGRDILSSTINTLLFIFLGEYLAMFIQLMDIYSFSEIINSKEFAEEVISIGITGIGCVAIIPLTAFVSSIFYTKQNKVSS
ncbi:MAG: YibE/F family protein [Anaerovoracaceae bacterium]